MNEGPSCVPCSGGIFQYLSVWTLKKLACRDHKVCPPSLLPVTCGESKSLGPGSMGRGEGVLCVLASAPVSPHRPWKRRRDQLAFYLHGPSSSGLQRGNSLPPHPPIQPAGKQNSWPLGLAACPCLCPWPHFLYHNFRVSLGRLTAPSFRLFRCRLELGLGKAVGAAVRARPVYTGWGEAAGRGALAPLL